MSNWDEINYSKCKNLFIQSIVLKKIDFKPNKQIKSLQK